MLTEIDLEINDSEKLVIDLLKFIGEDPNREGLRETPRRFLKAWKEWASGYNQNPEDLFKVFEDGAESVDQFVIVHGIQFHSFCEHHLCSIIGTADVGYLPNKKIIGLSKLARIVDMYARRLQVQERMTANIADLIDTNLKPLGVAVLIRAEHHCMSSRGVKLHGTLTTTSAMRGVLLNDFSAKAEFLQLCEMASTK